MKTTGYPMIDLFAPLFKKVRKDPRKLLAIRVIGGSFAITYGIVQFRQSQKKGKGHK